MTEEEQEKEINVDDKLDWLSEVLQQKNQKTLEEIKEEQEFIKEFHQLFDFVIDYLHKKYGHLVEGYENYLWILDNKRFVYKTQVIETIFNSAHDITIDKFEKSVEPYLQRVENKLNILINQKNIHILEKSLQNLLIKFPQIIESGLQFIKEEYNLGDTLNRGDLLFVDSSSKQLNIELKVVVPSFKELEEQLSNYLNNIQNNERLMYIAPKLTSEQEQFCNDHNIEFKIIDLDEIFN